MAWVENVNKRTQKAKHFYDITINKWRAEFTVADRHYHDGVAWQDIDENIVDDTGTFDKRCDKTRHIFQVASGGNRRWYPRRNVTTEYVDITGIQYWSVNRWRNLSLPAAVWKSDGAEWDMTNLYASITNTWHQIKTEFILKNSNAYTRLRFAVSFVGLIYNPATGELTSTNDGLVWGYIQNPIGKDANNAEIVINNTYDGTYIEWSVNTTGAVFPISIDPTFTDGYGGNVETYIDTMIADQAYVDYNFGIFTQMQIANISNSKGKGLLRFDLSSIPAGSTCDSATLYLYRSSQSGIETIDVYVYSIASGNTDWVEGTKNAATAGAGEPCWNYRKYNTNGWAGAAGLATDGTDFESSSLGSFSSASGAATGTEYSTTLTASRIEDWFGSNDLNYGLLLKINAANFSVHSFASSDHATTGYRPKLVVEYTEEESSSSSTSSTTTSSSSTTSTSSSTTTTSSSSTSSSSSSYTMPPPCLGELAFGEQNPLLGEVPVSWATWDDGAGGAVTVIGDVDWGKLEIIIGDEARSRVYDTGTIPAGNSRIFTMVENRYGTGQGTAILEIRGDTAPFNQDDVLPNWEAYTVPIIKDWRYVQYRIVA